MMNRAFAILSLHFEDFESHDWVSWFTVKLVSLLPSLTAEMLQRVTSYTDCDAYHVMYAQPAVPTAATSALVFGHALANSPSTWITRTCAGSSRASAFEALDLLSASQVAQLAAQSGALNNADLIRLVFDRLDGDNALQDVGDLHFEDFESHDWVSWFTVKLLPLLPSLTAEMLQRVTSYTDCDAYHVIVGALSSVFEQMTSLRQQELTPVLLGYLKQRRASGSTCSTNSSNLSTCLWACFGKFSIYVDYEDLRGLIEGFGSFEALDLLSASQVAQLAAQSGALNNADLIRLVFDRLDGDNALQDVGEFLTALLRTSQALDINPVVRDIMMNRAFAILSLHFEDFESHDWVSWFTVKLLPLLPSLTAEMLQRVTSYTDCDAYHVIVGALSSVFEQMTSLRQQELTPVLLGYLKQRRASGATCSFNRGSSLSTCLWACFGKFSIYVDYEDLRELIEGFGSFEALDLLSASQVAQLAAQSGALNNADLIRLVFDRLDGDNALQDVGEFLTALLRTSQALDINPVVRDIMMNRAFAILSLHFEDFESHDWVSWFTVKLVSLLPSLTAEMLQRVTSYTDCDAYHVIVGALSSVFEQMTSLRQQELTPVLLGYLKQRRASGSTCSTNSSNLSTYLWACFGKFSIYVDYEDLRGLIEGFGSFEALDLLSASQVAQLAAQSGALNNADLIRLVFDRLDGDNALQDVGEFLTALLRTSQALDINPVVRDIMMNRAFAILSLHFEDFESHDWVSWFTVKLLPLLPSLTAEMLQRVTSYTDCDAYHVIVGALSSVFEQMTSLRQQELTPVLLGYLKQRRASGRSSGAGPLFVLCAVKDGAALCL
ncbi:hypothetical protein ABG768_016126 [Culter alburnus]|uniref:Threonine-rich GPI-anchored glyco n=1 Tax=Culter alburnus TaxID=194366 RepID=A0AAW1YY49_CULAL